MSQNKHVAIITCPHEGCTDSVPHPVPPHILPLLLKYQSKTSGARRRRPDEMPDTLEELQLVLSIHTELAMLRRTAWAKVFAGICHWPIDIAFITLPARIFGLRPQISQHVHDRSTIISSFLWNSIVDDVERAGLSFKELAKLGWLLPTSITAKTRPGYYGEKGMYIIVAVLQAMFPFPSGAPFDPLPWGTFITLYLLPYVGASLIAQDRNTTFEDGWDIMRSSASLGYVIHRIIDEDEMDAVVATVYLQRPLRYSSNFGEVVDRPKPRRITRKVNDIV